MEEIVKILQSRFRAIEEAILISDRDFVTALFDYCAHVGSSKMISKAIKQMAVDFDIDADTFRRLFIYGALRNGFRNVKLKIGSSGLPLFWDKGIEKVKSH